VFTGVLDIENVQDKIIDFSKMHQTLGDKVLSEKNGSQNKNIGDGGDGGRPVTYSEFSADRLNKGSSPEQVLSQQIFLHFFSPLTPLYIKLNLTVF